MADEQREMSKAGERGCGRCGGALVNALIPLALLVAVIVASIALTQGGNDAGDDERRAAGGDEVQADEVQAGAEDAAAERADGPIGEEEDPGGGGEADAVGERSERGEGEDAAADGEASGFGAGDDAAAERADRADLFELRMGGETFYLEKALDQETRVRGLSFRESIARDGGMIFAFPSPQPLAFVMRDCRVPIDIGFLADDGTILNMYTMRVQPRREGESDAAYERRLVRYPSARACRLVVEFQAGTFARLGVRTGDRIEGDFFPLILNADPNF